MCAEMLINPYTKMSMSNYLEDCKWVRKHRWKNEWFFFSNGNYGSLKYNFAFKSEIWMDSHSVKWRMKHIVECKMTLPGFLLSLMNSRWFGSIEKSVDALQKIAIWIWFVLFLDRRWSWSNLVRVFLCEILVFYRNRIPIENLFSTNDPIVLFTISFVFVAFCKARNRFSFLFKFKLIKIVLYLFNVF